MTIKTINLTAVDSSQIHAIAHEGTTLFIQFKSKAGAGSVYSYANFTAEQFAAFKGAESIGRHFGQHIKPATEAHPFTRLEDVEVVVTEDDQGLTAADLVGGAA